MTSFKLMILVAFCAATTLAKPSSSIRIVGGVEAEKHEFPHQVSLQWNYNNGQKSKHFCGGSLIAEGYVLTAGHCTLWEGVDGWMEVVAGVHDFRYNDDSIQRRQVDKVLLHENFTEDLGPWDIGILRVDRPFQLTKEVQLVELPVQGALHYGTGIVSGWGSISTEWSPEMPSVLMKTHLPILELDECRDLWQSDLVDESNVCAGTAEGLSNTCSGDSGGPLVQIKSGHYEQVGIASWGRTPCGSPNAPGVFTRVSYYIDWIREHMAKDE